MSTKVTIIGSNTQSVKSKIQFVGYLNNLNPTSQYSLVPCDSSTNVKCYPHDYKYIELICKGYNEGWDLMFAYNNENDRGNGTLFYGYFNDGVV